MQVPLTSIVCFYIYLKIRNKLRFICKGMDEHGILACSETIYFSYISSTNTDRRSTNSLQTIYTLQNSNISTCFTNITSVIEVYFY